MDDGGPALTSVSNGLFGMDKIEGNLTLRDWFAGQETLDDVDLRDINNLQRHRITGELQPVERDILVQLKCEAKIRAAIKLIRADAMIEARKAAK